jgi:aminoglycoside 3-N-acetyltransferase
VLAELKRRLLPKGGRRSLNRWRNRLFRRVSAKRLARDLRRLGLADGDLVCVHSSLSGVGYLVRGADTVIEALLAVVGERGTVMMPTFSGADSTYRYVKSGPPPFDPERAPVTTGALADRFRHWPGVRRSLHPTHSVAARGPLADELLRGHEQSDTPFGDETPYARVERLGGKVLLLNSNANSLLHRIQEEMDWPNHYRRERFELQVVAPEGTRTVRTAVHAPGFFDRVVLPGKVEGEWKTLHMPWYGLQFMLPDVEREQLAGLNPDASRALAERQVWLEREGILRFGRVGYAPAALLDAPRYARRLKDDLRAEVTGDPSRYEPSRMEALGAQRPPA